ncbi:MAG: hypothetical protein HQL22_05220 [Candidatus Omnitrophica bacterium]|nr:hypothetical protein [Candidatus Omnitrophota bacterium]
MGKKLSVFELAAIALIFVTGLIHAINAPDSFQEAAYKGWLFCANAAGAVVAAFYISRQNRLGWWLGLGVAAGAFLGYVASRTVGLPMIPAEPDAWLEPLGVASLIAEGLFIGIFIYWKSEVK